MAGENPGYVAWLHTRPCIVCQTFRMVQTSPTEAHHTICDRGGNGRTHDEAAIPLCMCHHQGLRHDRDKMKLAIHQSKSAWVAAYGADYSLIQLVWIKYAPTMPKIPTKKRARAKIKGRGFGKQSRKLQSRGFRS